MADTQPVVLIESQNRFDVDNVFAFEWFTLVTTMKSYQKINFQQIDLPNCTYRATVVNDEVVIDCLATSATNLRLDQENVELSHGRNFLFELQALRVDIRSFDFGYFPKRKM